MFTRKQLMNRECSHQEYYSQFVTPWIKQLVVKSIGIERLLKSTDPYLNDIPLREWDSLSFGFMISKEQLKKCGDFETLASKVCILKQAANMIINENRIESKSN